MKKALMPIILIFAAIGLLAAAMFFYEQKWGLDGPFPSHHHHGAEGEAEDLHPEGESGTQPGVAPDHDHDHEHSH